MPSEAKPKRVPHPSLRALDPPGEQPGGRPRRWTCVKCHAEGTMAELHSPDAHCPAVKVGPLSPEEQVREWVAGRPSCPNDVGTCCPDFSCCKPELLSPVEARETFLRGSQEERERWCMGFLGALLAATTDEKVYVTRGEPEKDRQS